MATILRSRATLLLNGGAASALMTHYWDSTGATQTALATEALARVRAMLNALGSTITTGSSVTLNPVLDEVDVATGQIVNQVTGALPAAVSFTGAGDYLPLQTQAVMRFATSSFVNGRRLQGRSYVPGLNEGANSPGGNIQAAVLTTLGTAAGLLGTTVVTAMNQRVWHRAGPGGPGVSDIVTSRSVSPSWATLRSRRK